ncbi:dTMP kinase [Candidatus Roizmanbacteria bacterium RIFCSPHIGHO2_12_FULL_44_10]|uniref:Thymidylate kinase n=1 Tax=Candidatus Roizmanbacteria bacterium RIFCSPHIGHO2_12_FULL_44_10 TaxID=1802054 RepID=A0A1F7I843_9BACT|nr:MAG: dTMP kinase [Candidatus Roizmanbacteria bacterium RIFCSPHIGHO2_12_FULL_44_10]
MAQLITVEGGEFTGKTTVVVPALERIFRDAGKNVQASREPGGSPKAEKLRTEIFEKLRQGIPPEEQALLFNQARKVHLDDRMRPFLGEKKDKDTILILDRYLDSTRAYQGLEGGVSMETLKKLEVEYVGDFYPDLTFILYFPEEIFEKTLRERHEAANFSATHDRSQVPFDLSDISVQIERQRHHLKLPVIAKQFGEHRAFELINSAQNPEAVISEVKKSLKKCFPDI